MVANGKRYERREGVGGVVGEQEEEGERREKIKNKNKNIIIKK